MEEFSVAEKIPHVAKLVPALCEEWDGEGVAILGDI